MIVCAADNSVTANPSVGQKWSFLAVALRWQKSCRIMAAVAAIGVCDDCTLDGSWLH